MEVIMKVYLQRADSSVEVRRIPVSVDGQRNNGIFKEMFAKIANAFPSLTNKRFSLKWKDSDGDFVMMSSDEEVMEAVSQAQGSPLKIYVTMDGEESISPEEYVVVQADNSDEGSQDGAKQSDHAKADPFEDGWPFMGPMGMPFPPPPGFGGHPPHRPHFGGHPFHQPPFGHPMGFHGGMGGMRKRGHSGHDHSGYGMRMHGPFAGHGFYGGPHPGQGMRMHMFAGHHFPGGAHPHHPFFHGAGMYGHHGHHGPHGHHGHHHKEEKSWKAELRDAVPVAHRRWAKAYIRNWRNQNLKNATSTSSDSEQESATMEAASVPEAYAKWLDMLLPKWHQRWGQKNAEADGGEEANKEEKQKLKASVPMEFRKWARWYLIRRFGKKEAPKFKGDATCQMQTFSQCGGPCSAGKMGKACAGKGDKKEWKKAYKMHAFAASVPAGHRKWAKKFIRDWRKEQNIADAKAASGNGTTSESEESETEVAKGGASVPEDYARWLRKFLPRWHMWRGQFDRQKVDMDKTAMREFKDTVPMTFRQWVKFYMCRRYGKGVMGDSASQFRRWLLAFQRKWLSEKEKEGGSDGIGLTSSDDDAALGHFSSDNDTEQEMESSLKKLRLMEDDPKSPKKNVHFDHTAAGNGNGRCQRGMNLMDSDASDTDEAAPGPSHGMPCPGFRKYAKAALSQWDGQTLTQGAQQGAGEARASATTPQTEGSEQIPPHVYNWMAKMMMKMQMKKMKQEMKMAKHAAKAAMKAQKFRRI